MVQGILVDKKSGNFYVTDVTNNTLLKFNSKGHLLRKMGTSGSGIGQFSQPYSVCMDSKKYIYIVDMGNNRIQKLDSTGKFITKWGIKGSGNSEFFMPTGIVADPFDNIWVTDYYNNRIQKFTNTGSYINQWSCANPSQIKYNTQTNQIVVSIGSFSNYGKDDGFQIFDISGNFIINDKKTLGWGISHYRDVRGIDINSNGEFFIVENALNRVKILQPIPILTSDNSKYNFDNDNNYYINNNILYSVIDKITVIDLNGNIILSDVDEVKIHDLTPGLYIVRIGNFIHKFSF